MRFLILCFALMLIFVSHARAGDENVIKIVQPDGSVVVVKLPDPEPQPAPEREAVPQPQSAPKEEARVPQEQPSERAVPEAAPVPASKPERKAETLPPPAKPRPVPTRAESEGRIQNPEPAPLPVLPPTPGRIITKEIATQIALENAPPARSMMVVKRTFNGRLVWVVTFRTDAGTRDVLVDAETGEIVVPQ